MHAHGDVKVKVLFYKRYDKFHDVFDGATEFAKIREDLKDVLSATVHLENAELGKGKLACSPDDARILLPVLQMKKTECQNLSTMVPPNPGTGKPICLAWRNVVFVSIHLLDLVKSTLVKYEVRRLAPRYWLAFARRLISRVAEFPRTYYKSSGIYYSFPFCNAFPKQLKDIWSDTIPRNRIKYECTLCVSQRTTKALDPHWYGERFNDHPARVADDEVDEVQARAAAHEAATDVGPKPYTYTDTGCVEGGESMADKVAEAPGVPST